MPTCPTITIAKGDSEIVVNEEDFNETNYPGYKVVDTDARDAAAKKKADAEAAAAKKKAAAGK